MAFFNHGGGKNEQQIKKGFIFILLTLLSVPVGCAQTSKPVESNPTKDVIYEAVFLDNDEIAELFASVRGEIPPFDNVTQGYHVTTEFMPEKTHFDWYGEQVNVHITTYAAQDVKTDDGQITANEGFKVEMTSENTESIAYLDTLDKNYHITGAYQDAAKYTEYIDFSVGEALDVYVMGTFGGYFSDGTIDLSKE